MAGPSLLLHWRPAAWESLDGVAAVGNGSAGPLCTIIPLVAQPHLRKIIAEQDENIVITSSVGGNTSINNQGSSHSKSMSRLVRGDAAEADRDFRKLRGQLEEQLRQLGGTMNDAAETLDGTRLIGFSFNYTQGAYRGRVEGKLETQGTTAHQVRLDIEEKPE